MAIQKTEAFVLRTQPFRSSSLILTFFSRDFGKMKGIAKGVRKEREMRGALFELFTHLDIVFYEKTRSELHLISEASIIDSFNVLRSRLDTISYASYFSELVDVLTEVHDPHSDIFTLLEVGFRYLPVIPGERLSSLFEIKLLNAIGWLPHITGCIQCQNAAFEHGFFSVAQGALLCPSCARNVREARPLSTEALTLLRGYVRSSIEEGLKVRTTASAERELRSLLENFLAYRLGAPLKTRQFMQQLQLIST